MYARTMSMRHALFGAMGLLLALLALALGGGLASAQTEVPPQISTISASQTATTAAITWQTNASSTSRVAYGTTTEYTHFSAFDASLVREHSVVLTSLLPNTLYHFQVISGLSTTSSEIGSTTATSTGRTFMTGSTTATSTPHSSMLDLSWLKNQIILLLQRIGVLETQVASLIAGQGGTMATSTAGTAIIEQNGASVRAGTNIDFAGRNFGPEELIMISRGGSPIGRTAFSNLAGSFTTGSITVSTTTGSYTYTFVGQESGRSASATITVIP